PDGIAGELDAVAHAELFEHIGAMTLDGLLTDRESLSNLMVVVALGDQLDYLQLTRGQRIWMLLGRVGEVVADGLGDGAGIEERFAANGGAAGAYHVAIGERLEHVAAGTGPEGFVEELLVVVHREHQDLQS